MKEIRRFFTRPESFFLVVLAYLPFERMYDRFFRKFLLEKTTLSKGVIQSLYVCPSDIAIILFFSVLGFLGYLSWKRLFWEREAKYTLFLLATLLFSLIFSSSTDLGIWLRFFYLFVSILLFNGALQIFQKKDIRPFIKSVFFLFLVLGFIETVIAIGQYFSQGSLGLSFLAEPKISSPGFTKIGFTSKGVWLFDFWRYKDPIEICRAFGTFSSPNLLGGYYLVFLFAIFGSWFFITSLRGRFFLSMLLFLEILGLFTTYSRAALFSFFLMSFFWFFFFYKRNTFEKVRSLYFVFLASSFLCFVLLFPQILSRGGIVNYHDLVRGSDQGRVFTQNIAKQMFQEKPLLGWGYSQFSKEHHPFLPQELKEQTWMIHNIYLLFLVEGGIFGLGLFVVLLFFALKNGWKKREDPLVLALFLLFLGVLCTGFCDFYWLFLSKMRHLFFFLAALLIRVSFAEKIFTFRYSYPKITHKDPA